MKTSAAKITALLILSSIFVSCGMESAGTSDVSESVSTTTTAVETDANHPVFPEISYDGDEILFLTEDWRFGDIYDSKEIYAETIDGSLINDAVYNRNQRVQEQFDVVISDEAEMLQSDTANNRRLIENAKQYLDLDCDVILTNDHHRVSLIQNP